MVLREVAREHVRGGAEPSLGDGRAHDVGDIRTDRLGDRRDVDGQAGAPRDPQCIGDRDRVRAEVERQAHGRHAVGEELDQPADDARQVAAVGHLVVTHRLGSLDGDARAVGQHAVERLQRQARCFEPLDGPGDDADVGEAAPEGGLGEVARFDRSVRRSRDRLARR